MQATTGIGLDATGEMAVLDSESWRRLRSETGDPPADSDPAGEADWHEARARDAEAMGRSFTARWHLDRLIAARPGDGLLRARRARAWLWAGDGRSADADLARTIELGPRDRVLHCLTQRAEDFRAAGRPDEALRLLDRVIAARPGDWLTYALRARVFEGPGRTAEKEADLARAIERGADIPLLIRAAEERGRAGRWHDAAGLYDRAIARGTVPYEVWFHAAIAHLEIDDEGGFRRICQALRDRHPATIPQVLVGKSLADVFLLGPGGAGDDGRALGWSEGALAGLPARLGEFRHAYLNTLGGVLYRAGRYGEAIRRIDEGIAAGGGRMIPEDAIFRAMACRRSGDAARARAALAGGRRTWPMGPRRPTGISSGSGCSGARPSVSSSTPTSRPILSRREFASGLTPSSRSRPGPSDTRGYRGARPTRH